MSNTWEYRFAFRVETTHDAPEEFRQAYETLAREHGEPSLCFFSPSISEGRCFASRQTAPLLWMLFQDSLALLSLERRSNAVSTYQVGRHDLLGFGQADFLLNCWFSVYPGNQIEDDGPLKVQFPSRASGKYEALARTLLDWQEHFSAAEDHCVSPQQHVFQEGLPHKFSHYIAAHSEVGRVIEQFFQPRMIFGRGRGDSFPNLLLALTSRTVLVLCDQSRNGWLVRIRDRSALLPIGPRRPCGVDRPTKSWPRCNSDLPPGHDAARQRLIQSVRRTQTVCPALDERG